MNGDNGYVTKYRAGLREIRLQNGHFALKRRDSVGILGQEGQPASKKPVVWMTFATAGLLLLGFAPTNNAVWSWSRCVAAATANLSRNQNNPKTT
jgi:hypothetical protein